MSKHEDLILKTEKLFLKHGFERMSKYFGKKKEAKKVFLPTTICFGIRMNSIITSHV